MPAVLRGHHHTHTPGMPSPALAGARAPYAVGSGAVEALTWRRGSVAKFRVDDGREVDPGGGGAEAARASNGPAPGRPACPTPPTTGLCWLLGRSARPVQGLGAASTAWPPPGPGCSVARRDAPGPPEG